jgi:lysophospholipase L1-like esterase
MIKRFIFTVLEIFVLRGTFMSRIAQCIAFTIFLNAVVDAETPSQSDIPTAPTNCVDCARPLDWADLAHYRTADSELRSSMHGRVRVVFMGDSITKAWADDAQHFFPGKSYIDRGISGQTTPQMLVRFQQDVVALKPSVVVINGGTNDIAGNTGPSTLDMIEDNLKSMVQIANENGIKPVLASVTPAFDYPWRPGMEPAEKIVALNAWMKAWCVKYGCVYCDYFSALTNEAHGMKEGLSPDGVHPNYAGYAIMQPIAEKAIAKAMTGRATARSSSKD